MNSHIVNCLEPQPGSPRKPQPARACLVGLGRSPVIYSVSIRYAYRLPDAHPGGCEGAALATAFYRGATAANRPGQSDKLRAAQTQSSAAVRPPGGIR